MLWDNLAAHTVAGVEELLATCGARLIRLSPYAPDFNRIEQWWSRIKTFLRHTKIRRVAALINVIKEALDTVAVADIRGWFEFFYAGFQGLRNFCYSKRDKPSWRRNLPSFRADTQAQGFPEAAEIAWVP